MSAEMRWPRIFLSLVVAWCSSGCAVIAHEAGIFSWYRDDVRTQEETKDIDVTSEPQGARVTRSDPQGTKTELGTTPLVDTVPLSIQEHVEKPKTAALWVGAAGEIAVGLGLMIAGVVPTGTDIDLGRFFGLGMTGSFLATSGIVDG